MAETTEQSNDILNPGVTTEELIKAAWKVFEGREYPLYACARGHKDELLGHMDTRDLIYSSPLLNGGNTERKFLFACFILLHFGEEF